MEGAIKTIVSVFIKQSKGKENLGGKDFQTLVKNQLNNIMADTDSSDAIKNMRQGLDANQDGKVSFQEYMTLIGYLAQSLSTQQGTDKTTDAASSTPATKNEPPAPTKAEPEPAKPAVAAAVVVVKEEEEPATEKDDVVEVDELVEEDEENVEEVVEVS